MRYALLLPLSVGLIACRIERVRSVDSTITDSTAGSPVSMGCGITPSARVTGNGLGLLQIGTTLDAIRSGCALFNERRSISDTTLLASVDLGRDTAAVEFGNGVLRRITLHHQAYRTADSLGVGTHVSTLLKLRDATGLTERNRLYAVSPAQCGLRFMLEDPAPPRPAAQSGKSALRRLSGETRTLQLEMVGCTR